MPFSWFISMIKVGFLYASRSKVIMWLSWLIDPFGVVKPAGLFG